MTGSFAFRTLAQNRRVVEDGTRKDELDSFHEALTSISEGVPDKLVKRFFIECYVRGARISADTIEFEGSAPLSSRCEFFLLLLSGFSEKVGDVLG